MAWPTCGHFWKVTPRLLQVFAGAFIRDSTIQPMKYSQGHHQHEFCDTWFINYSIMKGFMAQHLWVTSHGSQQPGSMVGDFLGMVSREVARLPRRWHFQDWGEGKPVPAAHGPWQPCWMPERQHLGNCLFKGLRVSFDIEPDPPPQCNVIMSQEVLYAKIIYATRAPLWHPTPLHRAQAPLPKNHAKLKENYCFRAIIKTIRNGVFFSFAGSRPHRMSLIFWTWDLNRSKCGEYIDGGMGQVGEWGSLHRATVHALSKLIKIASNHCMLESHSSVFMAGPGPLRQVFLLGHEPWALSHEPWGTSLEPWTTDHSFIVDELINWSIILGR